MAFEFVGFENSLLSFGKVVYLKGEWGILAGIPVEVFGGEVLSE